MLEGELTEANERCAHFEKRLRSLTGQEEQVSFVQREIATLKEKLHEAEIQKLVQEQSKRDLEAQVKGAEEHRRSLEEIVREKQEAALESSKTLKAYKQKAYRLSEKVQDL